MMKKRTVVLLLAAISVVSVLAGAVGMGLIQDIKAQLRGDFTIIVDGKIQTFKNADGETVYPLLYDGTTYLPVRAIGELMGKDVYWYENEKKIVLSDKKPETTVTDADVIISDSGAKAPKRPAHQAKKDVDTSSFIGEEKAKQIALTRAGLAANEVFFDKIELDRDNGIWHYDVEFKKDRMEYDAEIRAEDGTILKWEAERD